jgi:tetratricopeptide (TPR) repeat protein
LVAESYQLGDLRAKGNEAFATGRYAEAESYYTAYVQRRPQEAEVEYQLGRTLLAMGRAQEAQDHLRIAHDLKPGEMRYIDMLARAILATGSREEVVEFLQSSAEGNMTAAGFMTLGYYAREAGFIDEAEAAYRRAVTLEGRTSPEPHRELAKFYRSVGDSQSEVERLRMVLSFDDRDAQANQRLRELGEVPGPAFALEPQTFD